MSTDITTPQPLVVDPMFDWDIPTPPTDLVFEDGEPLETPRHRIAMNLLINSVQQALRDRPNFFAGGNMFVYYSRQQAMNRDFRGPDFFVALDVDSERERKAWIIWEEDGRYPDVIIELLSDSTAAVDRGEKKRLYERVFKTPDYFIFDPFDPTSLAGWRLQLGHGYQPLQPNQQGWLWCETLELWLGTWTGVVNREPATETCEWLRFYDADGNLVLLPEEAEQQRADQERQRADQERQRADQERQRGDQEHQRADQERQRADQERQRADQERQRADLAEQEKAELFERLRARGIDPVEFLI